MRALINVLAGYRLIRLIQIDSITRPAQQWYWRLSQRRKLFWYWRPLWECPWCLGVWVGGGVMLADAYLGNFWWVVSRLLALSAVIGLLGWLDHEHIG